MLTSRGRVPKIDNRVQLGHSVRFNNIWAEVVAVGGGYVGCVNNSPTPTKVQLVGTTVRDRLYKSK